MDDFSNSENNLHNFSKEVHQEVKKNLRNRVPEFLKIITSPKEDKETKKVWAGQLKKLFSKNAKLVLTKNWLSEEKNIDNFLNDMIENSSKYNLDGSNISTEMKRFGEIMEDAYWKRPYYNITRLEIKIPNNTNYNTKQK